MKEYSEQYEIATANLFGAGLCLCLMFFDEWSAEHASRNAQSKPPRTQPCLPPCLTISPHTLSHSPPFCRAFRLCLVLPVFLAHSQTCRPPIIAHSLRPAQLSHYG